jgi:hypothetical protein
MLRNFLAADIFLGLDFSYAAKKPADEITNNLHKTGRGI